MRANPLPEGKGTFFYISGHALKTKVMEILGRPHLSKGIGPGHRPADAVATAQKALDIARRHGNIRLAEQIESWLKTRQTRHPSPPSVEPSGVPKGQ